MWTSTVILALGTPMVYLGAPREPNLQSIHCPSLQNLFPSCEERRFSTSKWNNLCTAFLVHLPDGALVIVPEHASGQSNCSKMASCSDANPFQLTLPAPSRLASLSCACTRRRVQVLLSSQQKQHEWPVEGLGHLPDPDAVLPSTSSP